MTIRFRFSHYVIAVALLLANIAIFSAVYASVDFQEDRKLRIDEAVLVASHGAFLNQTIRPTRPDGVIAYTAQSILSMLGTVVILMVGLDEVQL